MTDIRQDIVDEAKTWLATPYHHLANIKGAGVDCAMILVEIYSKVGVIERFDPRPYPIDWMLHHSEEKYLNMLLPRATEIKQEEAQPGDIALIKFGRTFSHSAIIIEWPIVIHAYIIERCVVLGDMTKMPFKRRETKYFNVLGDS